MRRTYTTHNLIAAYVTILINAIRFNPFVSFGCQVMKNDTDEKDKPLDYYYYCLPFISLALVPSFSYQKIFRWSSQGCHTFYIERFHDTRCVNKNVILFIDVSLLQMGDADNIIAPYIWYTFQLLISCVLFGICSTSTDTRFSHLSVDAILPNIL